MSITNFVGIAFSCCETFKYEQCHPARRSICWCSGIAFSGCETFKYEQCYPATRSICWSSGIAFSVWETFKYVLCSPVIWLIWWFLEIAFSGCETVRYFHRYSWRGLFCWCSGNPFSSCKYSITGIAVLQEGRLATSQMSCFRLWNVQICAVRFYKSTIYWLWGFASSVFEKFRYVQWWHETTSICWCLGITFCGLEIFTYEYCCHA